jgi:probable F420-dependent oxidoreductase
MSERAFRFGIVTATADTGAAWTTVARRAEDLGYDTLLVPDTLHTLAPFPALAAAGAATGTLRVGSYVLSAPNRSPALVAWEARSLQVLTDGRFELGLGAGRPGAERDAEALGRTFGTAGERIRMVEDTIRAVRQLRTPPRIMLAAGRPRMLRLAAEHADMVAFGLPADRPESELARTAGTLREMAAGRFDEIEMQINLAAIAETAADIPDWVARMVGGGDPRAMAAAGGIAFLLGTPARMADVLLRRRDRLGIAYIGISAVFAERFAPVVDLLRGK